MKKFKLVAAVLAAALLSAGCAGGSSEDSPDIAPGTIGTADPAILAAIEAAESESKDDVILYYYRPDANYSNWALWAWSTKKNDGQIGYDATEGKIETVSLGGKTIAYWNLSRLAPNLISDIKADDNKFNFLVRDGSWTKDFDSDRFIDISSTTKAMVMSGDSAVYDLSGDMRPLISSALSLTSNTIKANLSVTLGLETVASDNGFVLTADDGTTIVVTDVVNYEAQNNRNRNNAKILLLKLNSSLNPTKKYCLSREGFLPETGVEISTIGAAKDAVPYDGTDLGLTLTGNKAVFKVWAPAASDVKLLVYASADAVGTAAKDGCTTGDSLRGSPASEPIQMVKDASCGVWSATVDDISAYRYYKYQIVNAGTTYYVCDIHAKAASADAIAAQIVDINRSPDAVPAGLSYGTKETYVNPFGKSGAEAKSYTDAIIYEMHITDWSYAEDADSTKNVGKYLTIANGDTVIKHIKELGVTHVQLLPVFEFAETNANTKYNWGYNPYHYNVPEGRYVTAAYKDGTQAVLELRTLIAKLHEAGIAVNMDVVYNHTSGTGEYSLYDSTVPYYFYRFTDEGGYSNGSGCGNEIDSEAVMVKKYIIESLKHWMLDYHINGFRFDLMGCLSKETMADIYKELSDIDPNVMVYGEPWTGGTAAVIDGAVQAVSTTAGEGAGAFDDDFRDAIKGAEFGGFKQGQVQGKYEDAGIVKGLAGKSGKNNRNTTEKLGLGLHYVECHDNYTLFDKLAISYWQRKNDKTTTTSGDLFAKIGDEGLAEVKAENKLAAAYVFLSSGTAFLNGGQEFLRTKRGNENSYNTSNSTSYSTNGIDLSFKTTYSDVYNTYKGLIALRRAKPAAFGANTSAKAETVKTGVTKYTTDDFLVYFNATDAAADITTTGYTKAVDVSSGEPVESTTVPTSVPAKGFVILKK